MASIINGNLQNAYVVQTNGNGLVNRCKVTAGCIIAGTVTAATAALFVSAVVVGGLALSGVILSIAPIALPVAAGVAVVVVLSSLSGAVVGKLVASNTVLKRQLLRKGTEGEGCQGRVVRLTTEITHLREENVRLTTNITHLIEKNDEVIEENNELKCIKICCDQVEAKYKILDANHEKMKRRYQDVMVQYQEMMVQCQEMAVQCQCLSVELDKAFVLLRMYAGVLTREDVCEGDMVDAITGEYMQKNC